MYGIALAAIGLISTIATGLTIDAYGPVSDNAGGIAEMCELEKDVRARTDILDAAGNTTAAIGKGFAIGSAVLTALALFAAFLTRSGVQNLDLLSPKVFAGLLVGGALPYLFTAQTMRAVGTAAFAMIEEVRHQFRTIPGLLEGTGRPDYKRCVEISTAAALREMVAPAVLVIGTPLLMGLLFGIETLAGLLAGSLVTGLVTAVAASNAGGAWDNAKKYIEAGACGGKGSDAHKAAVVGDTVGDPFKDTSGPSLNILMKLMAILILVFAPFVIKGHAFLAGLFGF
jgi:K(+)-stimulated pyrophosphate-energized sodium pump